jgi:hypothetical protein
MQLFDNNIDDKMGKEEMERLNLPKNTFRFKFSQDFMDELYNFSKIHQYDDRESFKEAWKIWTEENDDIVQQEIQCLTENKYDGDILTKMYKSARYYFRKKSTEKKDPKERRQYINVDEELLKSMDLHIIKHINDNNYKPKTGFDNFCETNYEILKKTVVKICQDTQITNAGAIQEKCKKTYKNRYFILVHTRKNANL